MKENNVPRRYAWEGKSPGDVGTDSDKGHDDHKHITEHNKRTISIAQL